MAKEGHLFISLIDLFPFLWFAVEESDIIDLEKRYWLLKAQSRTGRFDLETFAPLVSPPIHQSLSEGMGGQQGAASAASALLALGLSEMPFQFKDRITSLKNGKRGKISVR